MANQARRDQSERLVEVEREKLVETLKQNRDKHIENYKIAITGYRVMATAKLKEGYEAAKLKLEKNLKRGIASLEEFDPENPQGASDYLVLVEGIQVSLKVPRNYSKEYDAAIDMAEWDVRKTLELTHAEFQCFVRDEWNWTNDFSTTNAMYRASGARWGGVTTDWNGEGASLEAAEESK